MVDLKKVFTHSRMPANTRISDVIAFAESIGCAVEFRLVQHQSRPATVAVDACLCEYPDIVDWQDTCLYCGKDITPHR